MSVWSAADELAAVRWLLSRLRLLKSAKLSKIGGEQ